MSNQIFDTTSIRPRHLLGLIACLGAFSCASRAPKVDLPAGSDPQPKISETQSRLDEDRNKQYDQISPQHFKLAQDALTEARHESEKGEASDKILGKVGEALAQLQIVEDNGQKNANTLGSVLEARTMAKNVKADSVLPQDFNAADKQLQSLGEDAENGNSHPDAEKLTKLQGRYSDLELQALKVSNLGEARSLIEKAENNGAKKKAPTTDSEALVKYDAAARSIEANRRNPDGYRAAVADSVKSAKKLDQVLKTINDSKASEVAAVQIYDQQQSLVAQRESLQEADQKAKSEQESIQSLQGQNQNLQGENQKYADKQAMSDKIAKVKAEFSPEEAEVLQDNNKIIIRLKTMKFSTARFDLTSSSLGTLQKVKEMIEAVPVSKVIVEGHTDSVGTEKTNMELSQKRADAIKNYFVAEKTLPDDKVEAKGYGYEKPLTSNKTKAGRATNRRVDVVIETAPAA